jgi:RND family efflux transporter MFP subunit
MTHAVRGPGPVENERRPWRLGSILLLVAIGAGCAPRNEYVAPPPPDVTTAIPLSRDVQEYFEATGWTATSQRVELRARVSGYLETADFPEGGMVAKDKLLFVIDREPYQVLVDSAQAAVDRAQSQLTLAEQSLTRSRTLADRGATTGTSIETAEAQQAGALADVSAAQASLRKAKLDFDDTQIFAPFDGRISERQIDPKNLVQAGETLLATLEAVSPMHAYFTLSEADLIRFRGMVEAGEVEAVAGRADALELAIGESGPFRYDGELDFEEFGIDPATGTTMRRATFKNLDGSLIPGLFVRIRTKVGEPKPRLLVEERALGADQRGDYLLVVNSEKVVEQRIVKLGQLDGNLRVILSGLRTDDLVIINGLQRARPGSPVNPKTVVMGAPPEASGKTEPETGEADAGTQNKADPVETETEPVESELAPETDTESAEATSEPNIPAVPESTDPQPADSSDADAGEGTTGAATSPESS